VAQYVQEIELHHEILSRQSMVGIEGHSVAVQSGDEQVHQCAVRLSHFEP